MNFSNSSSSSSSCSTLLSDVRNPYDPHKKAKIVNLLQKIRVYKCDRSHPLNKQKNPMVTQTHHPSPFPLNYKFKKKKKNKKKTPPNQIFKKY